MRAEGFDRTDAAVVAAVDLVRWELSLNGDRTEPTPGINGGMADESLDIAAQEAEINRMVAEAHEHITASRDAEAAEMFDAAAEAALRLLVARVESGNEPPAGLSEDERVAWRLVVNSSIEFQHGNGHVGDWYRAGARCCALERYTRYQV